MHPVFSIPVFIGQLHLPTLHFRVRIIIVKITLTSKEHNIFSKQNDAWEKHNYISHKLSESHRLMPASGEWISETLLLREAPQTLPGWALLCCWVPVRRVAHIAPLCLPGVEQCVPSQVEGGVKKSDSSGKKGATTEDVYQPALAV